MSLPPKIKPSSIVNAYLFYAQRLLQFENLAPQSMQQTDKLALSAGVSLCLKQAWQAWLDELGRYLNKELKDYSDFLLAEHRSHPEIELLLSIQQTADNWLSQLLICCEPMVQAAKPVSANDEIHDVSGRIKLLQVDSEESVSASVQVLSEAEQYINLINAFKKYISQVRKRQEEW